ncbi:MAG: hypothetical protein ABW250_05505 [Pyrinomonadaceae bacterium]
MTERNFAACATRARGAGGSSARGRLLMLAALVCACAAGAARAQEASKTPAAAGANSIVGAWHATLPSGLRVATLTVVPDGGGFGGAFVGYDYERPSDPRKPLEGPPPRVSIRTGSLLTAARLEGNAFTFKFYLRHPSPPPGKPAGYEVTGEVRFTGGDTAELRVSAPHKPEPMILKLTRE